MTSVVDWTKITNYLSIVVPDWWYRLLMRRVHTLKWIVHNVLIFVLFIGLVSRNYYWQLWSFCLLEYIFLFNALFEWRQRAAIGTYCALPSCCLNSKRQHVPMSAINVAFFLFQQQMTASPKYCPLPSGFASTANSCLFLFQQQMTARPNCHPLSSFCFNSKW